MTRASQVDERELLELSPLIRSVVSVRVHDPDAVEDLVQETLTRLLAAGHRLDGRALAPYAVVTARNLVRSMAREEDRQRRHRHQLLDEREPERPDELAMRREEAAAIRAALASLPEEHRQELVDHEVEGVNTASLAEASNSTSGAVALRLSRSRAKLRLNYLLELYRIDLPTQRCRPVLLALSAGDRRRQDALDAGGHLLHCSACARLSTPLLERQGWIAALVPVALFGRWWLRLARHAQAHPVQASVTTGLGVAVAVSAVLLTHRGGHRVVAAPPRPSPTTVTAASVARCPASAVGVCVAGGHSLFPVPSPRVLTGLSGRRVTAADVAVLSVPADEGFWIGTSASNRVWVQLVGRGESRYQVRAGQRVSFAGKLVANGPGFARRVGVDASEGAAQLDREGQHLEVSQSALRLR